MDIIFIEGLTIETIIGVYEWEHQIQQTIVIDIEMNVDICKAAISDDLLDTIDYERVATEIETYVKSRHFKLIESLAEHLVQELFQKFQFPWIKLRLTKKDAVKRVNRVGIIIERFFNRRDQ